ncbi:hypothetical protein EV424DRAFT_1381709, partial [Suillus variegatus]
MHTHDHGEYCSAYQSKVSSMRFSSAIFLAIVAALASPISATPTPINNSTDQCNTWCIHDRQCHTCLHPQCVSFSG